MFLEFGSQHVSYSMLAVARSPTRLSEDHLSTVAKADAEGINTRLILRHPVARHDGCSPHMQGESRVVSLTFVEWCESRGSCVLDLARAGETETPPYIDEQHWPARVLPLSTRGRLLAADIPRFGGPSGNLPLRTSMRPSPDILRCRTTIGLELVTSVRATCATSSPRQRSGRTRSSEVKDKVLGSVGHRRSQEHQGAREENGRRRGRGSAGGCEKQGSEKPKSKGQVPR